MDSHILCVTLKQSVPSVKFTKLVCGTCDTELWVATVDIEFNRTKILDLLQKDHTERMEV